jgi:predicted ATPase
MADLCIDCLETSQIIVETHSENFILRLRRRIAEGRLNAGDVGLHYVDEDHETREIRLDVNGGTDNWPEGVFESDIEEAQAIVQAKIEAMSHMKEGS